MKKLKLKSKAKPKAAAKAEVVKAAPEPAVIKAAPKSEKPSIVPVRSGVVWTIIPLEPNSEGPLSGPAANLKPGEFTDCNIDQVPRRIREAQKPNPECAGVLKNDDGSLAAVLGYGV
jgi:hypothetical protein